MSHEARIAQLGLTLPVAPPVATYVSAVASGRLLFLAGKGPMETSGRYHMGRVGEDVSLDQAIADARLTGLNLLGAMREALGTLDRVRRVVKLFGLVNCGPEFRDHPKVIDGCSALFVEVFGEAGRHARAATGAHLPFNTTVEIEAVVEIA